MEYRTLGKTGLKVSKLGFGAMRLPLMDESTRFLPNAEVRVDLPLAIDMLHTAFRAGVNYIDTSAIYCQGRSEPALGEAIKGWRDKLVVATKNPDYGTDEKTWWALLEQSLERLQVGHIDVYHHHGLNWQKFTDIVDPVQSKWMARARDQGLIRHIAASIHDTPENTRRVIDTGYVEVALLPYSLLDRKLEEVIAHAHARGIGVAVMNPLAKGRLGRDLPAEEIRRLAPGARWWSEAALQFVWSNPDIDVALSGMMSLRDVERNVAAAEGAGISGEQRVRMAAWADGFSGAKAVPCTECGYCAPCPQGVNIPRVFSYYNDAQGLGGWDAARRGYQRWDGWNPGKQPSACNDCGACEPKCPQKISIRKLLKQAHAELS
jgi:predicted aldo/keto reductase-like oxidoreductase